MAYYMALVHPREDDGFDITVPDCPGCTASGKTMADAMRAGTEALRLWAEAEIAAGRDVPEARNPTDVRNDPDVARDLAEGALPALLAMTADRGVKKRVNVMIDSGLLEAIDAAAAEQGVTRSDFLAEGARDKIAG